MQIAINLASDQVVSSGSEPDVGDSTVVNGQYLIVTPPGTAISVDSTSYVIPQNAGSITGLVASELLIRFPMYDHVISNHFIEASDIAEVDVSAAAPQPTVATVTPTPPPWAGSIPSALGPRCQVGRGSSPPLGSAAGSIKILPRNSARATPTYGSLVTAQTNITPLNLANPGTDNVMMWWEIARGSLTEDVMNGFGTTLGVNDPALRKIEKIDQEDPNFFVYVSVDNGSSWFRAEYLEPLDLITPGVNLRIAFLNTGPDPIYLLGFALLLQDLP